MSIDKLNLWITSKQSELEDVLLKSAVEFYSNYSTQNYFPFDARNSGRELWLLGKGLDVCYDRPTIGFTYSLWYHPKRVNTFLKYFVNLIYNSKDEDNIEIFDLGAGTGAVQWAVGIIYQGMKELGIKTPKIRIISIDTSPFMLIFNGKYSWKNFIEKFQFCEEIKIDYRVNSWVDLNEVKCSNIWLCASYLFDHTDNERNIAEEFQKLIQKYKPNKILLLSSNGKFELVNSVANSLIKENYKEISSALLKPLLSGQLVSIYNFRNEISLKHALNFSGMPKWDIDTLYGKVLLNNLPQISLDFNNINLFIQPEKDRTKINLTEQQTDASKILDRPSIIIGPAGCGKSVVLTQKVKNIIENIKNPYDPNTKILVTTFNKSLVRYLGNWIEQILDPDKIERHHYRSYNGNQQDHSFFIINGSLKHNIEVMHFDVLPTKIGNVKWFNCNLDGIEMEKFHIIRMKQAIETFINTSKIKAKDHEKILESEFLLDEYQRIIYGLQCNTEKVYQNLERIGRGTKIQFRFQSLRRKIVWSIILQYLRDLKKDRLESFIIRRHRFLKKLKENGFANKFSHIIVDELQDCTSGDYEIFYAMLENPNNFTLAGDLAQSINLGGSFYIPRSDDNRMRNFKKYALEGSFRLPFRVSECIRPLSEIINKKFGEREGIKADIINPYKGAPPGARPIFIFAADLPKAVMKVSEAFRAYSKAFSIDTISIFERDDDLATELRNTGINTESEIILKAKGLEKQCVLWSTRIKVDTNTEIEEFVYTILTRTVSLLIILCIEKVDKDYSDIIKYFREDRLIFWDDDSKSKYLEIKSAVIETTNDDLDNSEEITQIIEEDINLEIIDA
jgi:DNA helicase-2/ATP-dependent DNA helicase PcrA